VQISNLVKPSFLSVASKITLVMGLKFWLVGGFKGHTLVTYPRWDKPHFSGPFLDASKE
jgi:hypothetical protein